MIEDFMEEGQTEIQMIVFQMGTEEYAVPITSVQEIIMLQETTRIPKSPAFVEGVINLRGNIIPIIDGKKKFNLKSIESDVKNNRIMILEVDKETIGLVVDSVSEVIHLKKTDIEPPPVDLGEDSDFLWGVGKYQDKLLILLNPQKFLSIEDATDLQKFAMVSEVIKQTKDL